jgi:hypothetical protein
VLGGTAQLVAAFSGGDGRLVPQQNGAMSLPILSGVPVEVGPLRGNVTYTVNVTSAAGRTVSRDLVVGLSGPGTWALLAGAAPAYGRTGHTATRLPDGRVLVAGGFTSFFGGQEFPSATELYDPAVGTISAGPALLHARAHHAAALLADGRVLLAGGSAVQGQPVDEAEVLDVTAGTATAAGSVGGAGWVPWLAALPGGVAMLHSESMYSASGAAVLRFDPGTGLLAPLTTVSGLGWVESFVMPDGRLLLLSGGRYGLTPSSLLDPGTGAVQDTGTTLQELVPFDAVQLQDGRVLALDAVFAELYEPASGAFSATGTPAQVSYGAHRGLALLADGRVLVVDGYGAELYDPATGEFAATGGPLGESVFTALPDGSVLGTGGAGERYRPP